MLTVDEIRARLEEAMRSGPLPDWLDEACARLAAEERRKERQRVYDVSTVGARIRTAREVRGYTQKQLAARIKMFPLELAGAERGTKDLRAKFVPRLCTALGVAAAWLLMESDEGGPPVPSHLQVKLKRIGWAEASAKAKHKQIARAELERCRGLRPPKPKPVIDDDGALREPAP